jgi:hypothetical protein
MPKKTKKINSSKPKISLIGLILMALSIGLVVWSLWPPTNQRQTLKINSEYVQSTDWQDCQPLARLSEYDFELVVPRAVWKGETGSILLTLHSSTGSQVEAAGSEGCSLAIETSLAINNLQSQPGEVILQPFVGAQTQSFIYTISAREDAPIRGKLWVYAVLSNADGTGGERLPLFAIPIEMRVWSIFSLPPILVRYCAFMILLVLAAFLLRRHLLNQE